MNSLDPRFHGEADTTDGARIIRRLCRHWGHKYAVTVGEASGTIQLGDVRVDMDADAPGLRVRLSNPQGEVPERLKGVVADHLVRMAGSEPPLVVRWLD